MKDCLKNEIYAEGRIRPLKFGDFPFGDMEVSEVCRIFDECIMDCEGEILTSSAVAAIPLLESTYRLMELYYRIKLLRKTIEEQIEEKK